MHQQNGPQKLWTKYYILIICFSILTGIANFMMTTGIPLYAKNLGGDNSIAGLMMGIFMIFAIIVRPLFGNLADTKSRRLVLIIGAIICTVSYFSYTFAVSVGMLLFLRAINGMGFSANTNSAGTVVADIIPKSRMSEGIGYFGISNVLATAIGPALTLSIINNFGYNYLFAIATVIGLLSFVCSYFMKYEKNKPIDLVDKKSEDTQEKVDLKQRIANAIVEKKAVPPSFVMLFVAVAMGGIQSFIPIYAATRGIENIGIFFTVFAMALLITRVFGGRLADHYGPSTVILPGYILLIISFITLAFATTLPMFLISGFLYGLGLGFVQPSLNAIMVQFCPSNRRGAGNSTFFTAMDIGSGGGAVVWGMLSESLSFTAVYIFCAICIVLSWIAYAAFLQKKLRRTGDTKALNVAS